MSAQVIDIRKARAKPDIPKPRISESLRKVSREFREEILRSHSYHVPWATKLSAEQYADLLYVHLRLRQTLEELFSTLQGQARVHNVFTGERKVFELGDYLNDYFGDRVSDDKTKPSRLKSDLKELEQRYGARTSQLRPIVEEMLAYMRRVKKMYSVALLGVFYMFEETLTHAGPELASTLDQSLDLRGKATAYLRGTENQKTAFWQLGKSLDSISDFQTQINIVTASMFSYQMYRELLGPYLSERKPVLYLFQ